MTKIRSNLYLGNLDDLSDLDKLKKVGITAVLNVAFDANDPQDRPREFLWVKVGLIDGKGNPMSYIQMAEATLYNLLNEQHVVFVHCRAGVSRSPYVIARTIAARERKRFDDVLQEIKQLRPIVDRPNRLVQFYGTGQEGLPPQIIHPPVADPENHSV